MTHREPSSKPQSSANKGTSGDRRLSTCSESSVSEKEIARREKISDSRKGMKFTPEHRANLRQAQLNKMTPEYREKMRQEQIAHITPEFRSKMRMVNLGRKHTSEFAEKTRVASTGRRHSQETREKIRTIRTGNKRSEETREKIRRANLGKKRSEEAVEKTRQAKLGKPQTAELLKKGPGHHAAISAMIRSPEGVVYRAVNISDFVRKNPNLFSQEDLIPNQKSGRCNALNGLGMVARIGKTAYPTWKGWTRVTAAECNLNDGVDLLQRESLTPDECAAQISSPNVKCSCAGEIGSLAKLAKGSPGRT